MVDKDLKKRPSVVKIPELIKFLIPVQNAKAIEKRNRGTPIKITSFMGVPLFLYFSLPQRHPR